MNGVAPLHFGVVAIQKRAFWSSSTKIANFTLLVNIPKYFSFLRHFDHQRFVPCPTNLSNLGFFFCIHFSQPIFFFISFSLNLFLHFLLFPNSTPLLSICLSIYLFISVLLLFIVSFILLLISLFHYQFLFFFSLCLFYKFFSRILTILSVSFSQPVSLLFFSLPFL